MIGFKVSREGKSVNNARVDDVIIDTTLESLPVYWEGEFAVTVLPAAADFGYSEVRVLHFLDFIPLAMGWVDFTTPSGKLARSKVPNFVFPWGYNIESRADGVYVTVTGATLDMSAEADFMARGYMYIFRKDLVKP